MATVAFLGIAFIYLPLIILALFSFNDSDFMAFPLQGFTLHWYEDLFADRRLFEAAGNTLVVGTSTVALAIVAGTGAAIALHGRHFFGKSVIEAVVLLPIIIPGVMLGLSLLSLYVDLGVRRSLWTVVLGYATFSTSFIMLIVGATLRTIDPAIEEAARDLRASYWGIQFRVILPMLAPAILGGAILCFVIVIDEYIIAFLNSGTKETLPLIVMGMMKYGISPKINALASLLYVVSFAFVTVAYMFIVRAAARNRSLA
ncbi:ABC transporter permease [Mesorhizobium sp. M3A.F.Ca.ET.201.01.1.1]|uniref:ABC transporter permease n=1 Tax=Mesorhizobium sp. M3A.F.Ca.ET.201.01.1.1 TaxID=2563946 RepID=UPI0010933CE7|nr:ABC transporter permease [Mesorhizobium sp. M3A.F.Ca.ET.201.01.1.1]